MALGSLGKATVHEPVGLKPLWGHKGWQLPAYIQHIANDLRERGMSESRAIATAIATVKRWAVGGGDVKPDTRAAAQKALAEWEALKVKAAGTRAGKAAARAMAELIEEVEVERPVVLYAQRRCPEGQYFDDVIGTCRPGPEDSPANEMARRQVTEQRREQRKQLVAAMRQRLGGQLGTRKRRKPGYPPAPPPGPMPPARAPARRPRLMPTAYADFSSKPWGSISESDYADANDYCRACLIDDNPSGAAKSKALCKLPVRDPNGGPVNKGGLAAAAGAIAGARTPLAVSPASKSKAARKLIGLYRSAGMTPPESLARAAGEKAMASSFPPRLRRRLRVKAKQPKASGSSGGKFNESLHPRGPGGKFSKKGGGSAPPKATARNRPPEDMGPPSGGEIRGGRTVTPDQLPPRGPAGGKKPEPPQAQGAKKTPSGQPIPTGRVNPNIPPVPGAPQEAKHPKQGRLSQNASTVRANGLKWGGRTFKSVSAFAAWLSAHGSSLQHFERRHPGVANGFSDYKPQKGTPKMKAPGRRGAPRISKAPSAIMTHSKTRRTRRSSKKTSTPFTRAVRSSTRGRFRRRSSPTTMTAPPGATPSPGGRVATYAEAQEGGRVRVRRLLASPYDEAKHPRAIKGTPFGGRWIVKGLGGGFFHASQHEHASMIIHAPGGHSGVTQGSLAEHFPHGFTHIGTIHRERGHVPGSQVEFSHVYNAHYHPPGSEHLTRSVHGFYSHREAEHFILGEHGAHGGTAALRRMKEDRRQRLHTGFERNRENALKSDLPPATKAKIRSAPNPYAPKKGGVPERGAGGMEPAPRRSGPARRAVPASAEQGWTKTSRGTHEHGSGVSVRKTNELGDRKWQVVGGPNDGERYGTLSIAQHAALTHRGGLAKKKTAGEPSTSGVMDKIKRGDRVTIRTPQGQERSGKAVMRSSEGGWVLNMGGPHGTPGLVNDRNLVWHKSMGRRKK